MGKKDKGNVKGRIKNIAGAWDKASENRGDGFGDFVPLDPGSYFMQLVKVEIGDFGDARKVMLKWCVVANDDGDNGKICTDFEGIEDPERLVWLQRMLVTMGVDLDEIEVETEDDLLGIFKDLIEERLVSKIRVTEKAGYTNMRVQKAVEIEEDDLVVADEVLASSGRDSQSSDGDDDDDDDDDSDSPTISKGDEVTWTTKGGKERKGKVKSVDSDDDTAKVVAEGAKKAVTVDLDDLTLVGGDDEDDDGDDDDGDDDDSDEVEVGDEVLAPVGSKGKTRKGKVSKLHGDGTCDVKFNKPTKKGTTHAKKVKIDDLEHQVDDE